jgi:hypothetical protein
MRHRSHRRLRRTKNARQSPIGANSQWDDLMSSSVLVKFCASLDDLLIRSSAYRCCRRLGLRYQTSQDIIRAATNGLFPCTANALPRKPRSQCLPNNSSAPSSGRLLFAQSECEHQQARQAQVLLIVD